MMGGYEVNDKSGKRASLLNSLVRRSYGYVNVSRQATGRRGAVGLQY